MILKVEFRNWNDKDASKNMALEQKNNFIPIPNVGETVDFDGVRFTVKVRKFKLIHLRDGSDFVYIVTLLGWFGTQEED